MHPVSSGPWFPAIWKTDLKKDFAALYKAKAEPAAMKIPKLHYLKIDVQGDPNPGKEFADATITLYGLAHPMKFILKKRAP